MERPDGLPEPVWRELVIAETVARSKGITLSNADEHIRSLCMAIARSVMPGVNRLVAEAEGRLRKAHREEAVMADLRSASRGYEDGFVDGEVGEYRNPWQERMDRRLYAQAHE